MDKCFPRFPSSLIVLTYTLLDISASQPPTEIRNSRMSPCIVFFILPCFTSPSFSLELLPKYITCTQASPLDSAFRITKAKKE